jgi:hypothetical protein
VVAGGIQPETAAKDGGALKTVVVADGRLETVRSG